ncbi:MAG TPA: DUF3077 domain-containing protein [Pseudomonas sp.]|uniref:DUF3077 domain-containing protein n=1 Tax=Pseudomonas sp. TaxID=306 RepID=UPI002B459CBC|nr:DUF3077 domain-containing protein [Pseudomonas sp.]HKS13549.1 DUF3077 domain-containing protein [Pseudomonas sp.]
MSEESKKKVTPGLAKFAEGEGTPDLFQVAQGVSLDYALEQASVMMGCVHRLSFVGVMDKDDTLVWAAHLLSGMGRALVEDVRVALGRAQE